jgi:GT2 family glycosyltransferase
MQQPKILVGCPTSEHKAYCLDKYAETVRSLTYPQYDILLVDNSATNTYAERIRQLGLPVLKDIYFEHARERITHSRNILREQVLEKGYDYFLCLEQDVIPPRDIIERLLQHQQPVVTGVYYMEYDLKKQGTLIGKKILPLLYARHDCDNLIQLTSEKIQAPQLLRVAASGLGCMLIHRSVLEKISFRYVEDKLVFDDIWFCQDLERHKIPLFVDTSVKCKHLMHAMDWDSLKK